MIRNNLLSLIIGVSVLAISACEQSVSRGGETAKNDTSSGAQPSQVACLDPKTGKLVQPGPDVECSVPEQDKVEEDLVVKELEGGGKIVDPKGKFDQNKTGQTTANRLAVLDRKTGKLITQRPDDAKAAARYDRSVARAKIIMKRQSKLQSTQALYPEVLANGGIIVDLQGQFQVPLVAKLSKDGQVRIRHQH